MDKPLESDWKIFRKRVPQWRERFLLEQNKKIVALFDNELNSPTEQFWAAEKKINAVARILTDCLDGHSRSKMPMYVALMYRHQMIGSEDLQEFSAELREQILRLSEAWGG